MVAFFLFALGLNKHARNETGERAEETDTSNHYDACHQPSFIRYRELVPVSDGRDVTKAHQNASVGVLMFESGNVSNCSIAMEEDDQHQ